MTFSELATKRPVLAVVMSILIMLFGALGYSFLGTREYPAIDPPTVNVRCSYTGASPEIIESQITEPLEKAINGIQGIRNISSSSSTGNSIITIEFDLGEDLEKATNDVRDKVSQAIRNLPQDIDGPPVVNKSDADGSPIIFMPINSSKRNIMELSQYAENVLQERLQTIPGVSQISIFGIKRPAMRLWMDPQLLTSRGLTVQDVFNALQRENIELPSGKVRGDVTELTVKTYAKLATEEEFNDLIIKALPNGGTIRFKDIGQAVLGPEIEETSARRNNVYGLSLAVFPQPGSNQIEIADEFYRRLEQIKKELPEDIILDVGLDRSKFVKRAVEEVIETLYIAVGLVVLIIYLFFRNWLVALRPLVDIPVSLIGTFFVMYIFDFSINVLTLLGIVLATGLVVDDGIVVTENIFKKIEQGMDKRTAVRLGIEEIFFAVISTSITLAVVFLPVIFLQGFTGRLFREFGVVVACAVLISAFVSLTLTPVLNIYLSGKDHREGWFYRKTEPFYEGLENGYKGLLTWFLRFKWIAVLLVLGCFGLTWSLSKDLKTELAPLEDRSIVRTNVTAPEGTDFDKMEDIIYRITQTFLDSVPDASMIFGITAPAFNGPSVSNSGFISTLLPDPDQRQRSQMEIYDQLVKITKKFPEVRAFPNQEQTITTSLQAGSQLPVQYVIQNFSFEKIADVVPKFLEEARKTGVFSNVDINLKFNKPELNIRIDRDKATALGLSAADVSQTLQLALSGRRFGYFTIDGKQYQVIGQIDRNSRDEPLDLAALYVRNNRGDMVQLDNIVSLEEGSNPPTLYHYNRFKSATFSASLAPGRTLGEGIQAMEDTGQKLLDDTFQHDLSGPSRDFKESSGNTSFAFILALLLVYLILAAQFESFIDPLIILITVPLAIAGAFLSLSLSGQTINIFSQIGMIMLIGLVTKNGILIVEFANQKREQGLSKFQAVLEASTQRFRPILMTSLATVLGALPIALSLGSAGRSRVPLGMVITGGMSFSLVLTLLVIPAMYLFLARKHK
jgi:multidrug efflux pump